ncbi:hypothetical protein AAFN46_13905 [Pseudomonas sp. CAU 1711]|uniref:hypothetical protein n=1 Tax=Pseudomonas sp. CAU 1711 TaxID=3140356 RepID=UPI0032613346
MALATTLLAACDEPAKAPPPMPSPPQTEPAPAPVGPGKSAEPHATADPVVVERAVPKVDKDKVAIAPPRRQQVAAEIAEAPQLPPVQLDLRLPKETVERLASHEPREGLPEQALLPPLFLEKPIEPGPFQLNGRLITNDRDDDYWQSVEGAELQIEFRN